MKAGKLGGDVLELAKSRAGEPREAIGVDVADPSWDGTMAIVTGNGPGAIVDVCEECGDSLPAHSVAQHVNAHARVRAANDMLTATRKVLDDCNPLTASSEGLRQLCEMMGLDVGASREGIVEALASAERVARPLRIGHRVDSLTGEDRAAYLAAIADLSCAGHVVLPKALEIAVVEPSWPNPSKMEPGQIWHFDGLGIYDGRFIVTDVDGHGCAGLRDFDRPMRRHDDGSVAIDAGCSCSAVIDGRCPARCIGFELDGGRRVMVGEFREAYRETHLHVRAVCDGGHVEVGRQGYASTLQCRAEVVASWPIVAAPEAQTGPTMYAECASSDVTEGEAEPGGGAVAADCGPSFTRPISPAIQAMIDAGYAVDPSLL